jgi:alpha-galactosidase
MRKSPLMNTKTLIAAAVVAGLLSRSSLGVLPTQEEMAAARHWTAARLEGVRHPQAPTAFFSFNYGGKPSAEFLKTWELNRTSRKLDDKRTEYTLTYTDPATGLIVRCVGVEYSDFPCVEWTLYFKNGGKQDTPILSEIQALDMRVERKPGVGGEYLLHHNTGSQTAPSDYQPHETVLGPGAVLVLAGAAGRPTGDHLSYFNLELSPSEGIVIALGWPGQLATRFSRDKGNGVRVWAGQELTHFKLLPGEEVRTPLVALQFWKGGDWLRAQNVWRRWFIAHNLRKPGGKLPPAMWCGAATVGGGLMEGVTEENAKQWIDFYGTLGLKPDFWWMDAGWYPCRGSWPNTGTWEVDKTRFPNGILPVTDNLHKKGIKSILWFEPERVVADTWLPTHHPEWIFGGKNGTLVNFGDPDAWKWMVERVDSLLVSEGIDIYRQDFNMDPLPSWRANDAADRQGISEIRHVTGLLAYWDELLRRHPEMLYDNCASGGRRNDLESMRRGVPFTKSDYALEPVGVQGETYGISMWLPYYAATWMWNEDAYTCRSNMAHVTGALLKADDKNQGKVLPKRLDEWRKTVANYWGDFWPLTPYSLDNKAWIGWQFDCPEEGHGVVQAFRRAESIYESARLKLRGLDANAVYLLTNLDETGTSEIGGRELLDKGLRVALKESPSAAIITYKKKS